MRAKMAYRTSMRTKKQIRSAFEALMVEEKQLSKVTVTAIVRRCDIDRTTFYAYYDGVYAIVEEYERETIDMFFDRLPPVSRSKLDIDVYLDRAFTYLRENETRYRQLLSCEEPVRFMDALRRRMTALFIEMWAAEGDRAKRAAIEFYCHGFVDMCVDYFRGQVDCTLDELRVFTGDWLKKLL